MLMLTSFMDESGHGEDPTLRFAGMAGFVAPAEKWKDFHRTWENALNSAGLKEPFHMKDFAHFRGQFADWKGEKQRREEFFGTLVEIIQKTQATPVGAVVSIEAYESLTQCQRSAFRGPYYIVFQTTTKGAALQAIYLPAEEKVAMVYAYNQEFGTIKPGEAYSVDQAGSAEQLWHAMKESTFFGVRMGSYTSRSPAETAELQAADIFAYELAKEFENRIKRPNDDMRWGLRQILKMVPSPFPMIQLLDRLELLRIVKEGMFECQVGVKEIEETQMLSAMGAMKKWFHERGQVTDIKIDASRF